MGGDVENSYARDPFQPLCALAHLWWLRVLTARSESNNHVGSKAASVVGGLLALLFHPAGLFGHAIEIDRVETLASPISSSA